MKRRIEQLLNGKFEYRSAPLSFSADKIVRQADAGSYVSGSFSAASGDGRRIKGFVYSSDPRVSFEPHKFYGADVLINWELNTMGVNEGEKIEGRFTVCSEHGEFSLPYEFTVRGSSGKAEDSGHAMSIQELCELARRDEAAACEVYASEGFRKELQKKNPEAAAWYRALESEQRGPHGLEEFLTGCGMKKTARLSLKERSVILEAPEQSARYTLRLDMSGWGYLDIRVESEDAFLRPEKKNITSGDFVGGHCDLNYFVDTNFLHDGKNFGRITVSTCCQTLRFEVQVNNSSRREGVNEEHVRKLMRRKMLTLYLDFRLKKIERQTWIDRNMNVINGYRRAGGRDTFADLFEVQLCYADGKKSRGQHILAELERHPDRFRTQDQYAYYLYLTTFFRQDSEYVDQIEERVDQLYNHSHDSWIMLWILLYLKQQYAENDSARLSAIEHSVMAGCSSPIMYFEASQIYMKNPYLLRKLGNFELRILLFSAKEEMITEELAAQISSLAVYDAVYDSRLMRILTSCYQLIKSKDTVRAICQILIAGNRKDPSCFKWYALGVNMDLRITGLYEYYIETMGTVGIEKMPQIVRMYFSYSTSLNYHKKAAVYRDISDKRESVPQVYRDSHAAIEHFVLEQLSMEHIDSSLAVLYERFITRRLLNRSLAGHLVRLLFTYRVSTSNPSMKTVRVAHRRLLHNEEYPLRSGSAKIRMYTNDAKILLSDADGRFHASSDLIRVEKYLDSPLLITYCRELVPDDPGLSLHMCSVTKEITPDTIRYFLQASVLENLTEQARLEIRKRILGYYMAHPEDEGLYAYLKDLPYDEYVKAGKKELICLLTEKGFYEQAFHLVERYGPETIPLNTLVCILSQTVLEKEYEEDGALTRYCSLCFRYGKYDDNILNYLLMYYEGPIEDMKHLWEITHESGMDTMALEEKILSLFLFMRTGGQNTEHIYESYRRKLGSERICTAYLNLKSYEYLVRNLPVNELIFRNIEQEMKKGAAVENVCRLALLQYYSTLPALREDQRKTAVNLMTEYDSMGIRFAFYQRFGPEVNETFSLEDKVFMEYVADPNHTVILHYRLDDEKEFRQENMKNMFEGIFVKEFVIFGGEHIECYVDEYDGDRRVFTGSRRILTGPESAGGSGSRFDRIGKMNQLAASGDEDALKEELKDYYQLEELARSIFTLI